MPDYSFWSWPELNVGAWTEARERIFNVDAGLKFKDKISRAVWRGNVNTNPLIREKLVEVARGKDWADVEALTWKKTSFKIEDFCKKNNNANESRPIE
ncbi:hypothetical protein ABW20_dc0105572 [Dactylellina cionopaga]|nr:hypothetical protein ABW20_dc0105572 [Dactylellina cionopaga]